MKQHLTETDWNTQRTRLAGVACLAPMASSAEKGRLTGPSISAVAVTRCSRWLASTIRVSLNGSRSSSSTTRQRPQPVSSRWFITRPLPQLSVDFVFAPQSMNNYCRCVSPKWQIAPRMMIRCSAFLEFIPRHLRFPELSWLLRLCKWISSNSRPIVFLGIRANHPSYWPTASLDQHNSLMVDVI